jgi:hypothetical protein
MVVVVLGTLHTSIIIIHLALDKIVLLQVLHPEGCEFF